MTVVESSVCGRPESGTKQSVHLEFKSTKLKTNETFTCRTNILEPTKNFLLIGEWDRLGSGIWENDQRDILHKRTLGRCTFFRPYDDLKVKVIIEMPQTTEIKWSLVNDHLEICQLVATFGKDNAEGRNSWRWIAPDDSEGASTEGGTNAGETNWLPLEKIPRHTACRLSIC